jgi:hypothetical protein
LSPTSPAATSPKFQSSLSTSFCFPPPVITSSSTPAIHLFDLNAPPPEDGDELRGGEAIADEAGVNIAGDEGGGGAVADEEIAQNVGNIASDEGDSSR